MTDAKLFALMLSASFIGAALVGIMFWGMAVYGRHERDGTHGSKESTRPLMAILVPLALMALISAAAFDQLPTWLDRVLTTPF